MSALPATPHHDVIVVGARCAGAATAMLLAERGHDVLVVDRAVLPSDTISTHSIARGGIVQLQRWGLLDDVLASGAPPIREVVFHADGTSTSADDQGASRCRPPPRPATPRPRRASSPTPRWPPARRCGPDCTSTASAATTTVASLASSDSTTATAVEQRARLVVGADGVRSRDRPRRRRGQ